MELLSASFVAFLDYNSNIVEFLLNEVRKNNAVCGGVAAFRCG